MLHIHTIRYYIKGTNNKFSSQHKTHNQYLNFAKTENYFLTRSSFRIYMWAFLRGAFDNARQNYSILILEINILYSSHSRLKLKCSARVYMYYFGAAATQKKISPIYVWFYIKFNGKKELAKYLHTCVCMSMFK